MRIHRITKWTVAAVVLSAAATAAAAPNAVATEDRSAVWERLAECESSGDWAANTGNGYYGGLQFNRSTWSAYGGDSYSRYPHHASREQQIDIAERVRDARGGYGAWPACARTLGLPR